jgi:class 3 adenylate cyclase/TolB-like protein
MAEEKVERKVTVILATDVVGYSTKMEKNEDQTLQTLKACRAIIEELIGEHRGRIFNTAGDSVLAEFPSAVEAVLCASEFQRTIKERNASVEDEAQQMEFRVGINMGDVVIEESNLYGDGVNVAARLEALAQPGGICLSKNVHDIVHKKMDLGFADLGDQKVKDTVVHAVDVLLDGSTPQRRKPKIKSRTPITIAIAAVLVISVIGLGSFFYFNNAPTELSQEETKALRDSLPVILVKPFKNVGAEDISVSNALTESLISSLSRYKGISVLSSSTSFHILETNMSDKEIAKNFGVKHAIQGSFQSFGDNTRLTLEVNDLSAGKVVWSDKVDFLLDDIFKVQDEIGDKILGQLQISAILGQQARHLMSEIETFDQYLLFVNYETEWMSFTKEGYDNTLDILEQLKSLNTNKNVVDYVEAWILHQALVLRLSQNKKSEDLKRLDYLTKSVIQNRGSERDYSLRALVELEYLSKDCSVAINHLPKSLNNSNISHNLITAGYIHRKCGDHDKSIPYFHEALRYSPVDRGYMVTRQLVADLYTLGRTEEIKALIGDKIDNVDMFGMILWLYASMELENGNTEKAKEFFERGINNGARGAWISGYLINMESAEKLTKALETLGPLD